MSIQLYMREDAKFLMLSKLIKYVGNSKTGCDTNCIVVVKLRM